METHVNDPRIIVIGQRKLRFWTHLESLPQCSWRSLYHKSMNDQSIVYIDKKCNLFMSSQWYQIDTLQFWSSTHIHLKFLALAYSTIVNTLQGNNSNYIHKHHAIIYTIIHRMKNSSTCTYQINLLFTKTTQKQTNKQNEEYFFEILTTTLHWYKFLNYSVLHVWYAHLFPPTAVYVLWEVVKSICATTPTLSVLSFTKIYSKYIPSHGRRVE